MTYFLRNFLVIKSTNDSDVENFSQIQIFQMGEEIEEKDLILKYQKSKKKIVVNVAEEESQIPQYILFETEYLEYFSESNSFKQVDGNLIIKDTKRMKHFLTLKNPKILGVMGDKNTKEIEKIFYKLSIGKNLRKDSIMILNNTTKILKDSSYTIIKNFISENRPIYTLEIHSCRHKDRSRTCINYLPAISLLSTLPDSSLIKISIKDKLSFFSKCQTFSSQKVKEIKYDLKPQLDPYLSYRTKTGSMSRGCD
mmetsp:Transcript_26793/g.23654  ORF Transcript_26793/g.23654 Transcript_26793/m.23654 type:complete len:253 (-) Transcript_26793:240-998(-)